MTFLTWFRKQAEVYRRKTLAAVEDLDDKSILWQPRSDAPSIGWLLWQIGETEESVLWAYYGQQPVYRFGRSYQSCGFRDVPSLEALLRYLKSTRQAYVYFIDNLHDTSAQEEKLAFHLQNLALQDVLFQQLENEIRCFAQISFIRILMGKPQPIS